MTLVEFFHEAGKLKDVKRTGWQMCSVPNPESVADHTYRTALMALILAPKDLDMEKCLKMAIIHDICEVYTDDIPAGDTEGNEASNLEEKAQAEKKAMERILSLVDEPSRSELMALWLECEQKASPEAKFIKELDSLEMAFQSSEYEAKGCKTGGLLNHAVRRIETPKIKAIFDELLKGRKV